MTHVAPTITPTAEVLIPRPALSPDDLPVGGAVLKGLRGIIAAACQTVTGHTHTLMGGPLLGLIGMSAEEKDTRSNGPALPADFVRLTTRGHVAHIHLHPVVPEHWDALQEEIYVRLTAVSPHVETVNLIEADWSGGLTVTVDLSTPEALMHAEALRSLPSAGLEILNDERWKVHRRYVYVGRRFQGLLEVTWPGQFGQMLQVFPAPGVTPDLLLDLAR